MSDVPKCEACGDSKAWIDCNNCEDGLSHHECGEDCCCCLYPENNVVCDICNGKSGWWTCLRCAAPASVHELLEDGRISWPEAM